MHVNGIICGRPAVYVTAEKTGHKGLNIILFTAPENLRENTFAFKNKKENY